MHHQDMSPPVPGFYWARWLTPWGETIDAASRQTGSRWEVVEVFANGGEAGSDGRFMALLMGVETPQPLSNLIWGKGPLAPPRDN